MSRVPRIRFKGFEEDWEQRKLGEVADIIGGGTPSTLNSDYWDGNIDWYSPAEIIDQIYVYRSQRKITELGFEKSSAKMLPEGTVLFTSRAGIGKTVILAKKGCTNQGFQSIVPYSNKLDSYFIFSRTEELKKYGELVGAGSTFVEVSGRQMENMQLMIPKTIGEQHIIGVLFSTFDHLITLHQRKLEKLKIIKKSMLENLFPQNGEKTPKIRFSGFTEDWEQRKLKYFADYKSSSLTVKDCKEEGKYDLYDANQVIGKTDKFVIDEDYITIIKDGAGVGRTRKLSKNTAFIGTMGALTVNNSDLDFLYATLNRIDWNTKTFGSTIPHIYFKDYGEKVYGEPSIEEQKKIGLYFKNIDTLITLHQSKLEKLQKIKKSMLESMFV